MYVVVMLATLGMVQASETTAGLTTGYESQYIFRGQKISDNVGSAAVSVSLPTNTDLSIKSYWNNKSASPSVGNETNLNLNQRLALDSASDLVIGGTVYVYPGNDPRKSQTPYTTELYTGINYKSFLNPSLRVGYNLTLKQLYTEGVLSQDIPLVGALSLRPAAALGWVQTGDARPELVGKEVKNGYNYGYASADLVYKIKQVELSAGARYNYLADSTTTKHAWFGAAATVRF